MSNDASLTEQLQQCLDDINGADVQKRSEAREKFSKLALKRYGPWARRELHGELEPLLGNKQLTGDLCQEGVFELIQAMDAGKCFQSVKQLDKYMRQVLRHGAVDMNRSEYGREESKRPKVEQGNDFGPALVELVGADPHTGPATAAKRQDAAEWAEKLKEPQRRICELSREGKTPEEIGIILNMTARNVRNHLNIVKCKFGAELP